MIEIVKEYDCSRIAANFSKDIIPRSEEWQKGVYLVLAGNWIYETLLAENEGEKLLGGDTRFRRSQALEPRDVLVINLQNLEAVKLSGYDV